MRLPNLTTSIHVFMMLGLWLFVVIPSVLAMSEGTPETTSDEDSEIPLVVCPYNLNHLVEPVEFSDHLRECRIRYCRENANTLRLIRCKVNSRHYIPEVELEFHERQCEDAIYYKIVEEVKTEPIPIKIPSSDSSDCDDESCDASDSSISSGDTEYSTSKDELLRRVLQGRTYDD